MQMHHFVFIISSLCLFCIHFFFSPMAFDALMSDCTPNLNYMRKRVARIRSTFVKVMLILPMKFKNQQRRVRTLAQRRA